MSKFIIALIIAFFIALALNVNKMKLLLNPNLVDKNKESSSNAQQVGEKKKILIKCNLTNELIDRDNFESERQCYYTCGDADLVRVDTSISYPCQDFIREER